MTEVPLTHLPAFADLPATHALASWKSWLAGRGFGVVPIADPRSFQWAGWWIGVVDRSDGPLADGPQHKVAVLAFGTPLGVVLSPQDPALLDRATAQLHISNAYAVASLNPVLSQPRELLHGRQSGSLLSGPSCVRRTSPGRVRVHRRPTGHRQDREASGRRAVGSRTYRTAA
ncbi:hypothetical protein [Cellulomonas aerilata]|uniref:Uncharacterized protein n=1 Tax=Cellulomonas aerilata TaxID=515326 RepID=A0A512DAN2_9CELL|nr:hypothetical protein [Cellulomonas aerilata]GEO33529.1 hypothetical protein CAE01nite_12540 [Cellulomonas aerilata]